MRFSRMSACRNSLASNVHLVGRIAPLISETVTALPTMSARILSVVISGLTDVCTWRIPSAGAAGWVDEVCGGPHAVKTTSMAMPHRRALIMRKMEGWN